MTHTATRISLELGCSTACDEFTGPLLMQMASGKYDECAVLELNGDWREQHRTARKRADRASRRGYYVQPIQRELVAADIYAINTSKAERQGRPMSSGYRQQPTLEPLPDYPCRRHSVHTYGVFSDERLVAYTYIYRAGDLALVSQILGHADHLENEIMYLLVAGIVEVTDGYLVYNRYDSGTDGLRFFKDRCGFEPTTVEWLP